MTFFGLSKFQKNSKCLIDDDVYFIVSVLRIGDVYPDPDFFPSRIQDPTKRGRGKNKFEFFLPKDGLDSGPTIRDPEKNIPDPDLGDKKAPDLGSGLSKL
jgi:hypothetical protein